MKLNGRFTNLDTTVDLRRVNSTAGQTAGPLYSVTSVAKELNS